MNIVDVLAIMPYYVSLFLLNDPIITPPEDGILLSTGPSDLEDDGSSVEGILQVFNRNCSSTLLRIQVFLNLGVQNIQARQNLQVGSPLPRPPVHSAHNQTEPPGAWPHADAHPHLRPLLRQPLLLHRGGGVLGLHLHPHWHLLGGDNHDDCGLRGHLPHHRTWEGKLLD